ncbi:MAG: Asp-tRNA(Asn)/Glu-tRNA(Gln) amidotransferase subunit GatC [Rhodospirillales bacterium]|nr:Asp-tRNA(Asn)/Glu-tRNA(Gln) amidotransferase subunit GatC [Rhodospirillales bacterium]MDE0381585.1 Asp-tRNA(Asn)/Glu-tRNA(Gln) amidotransferase subunit GatC [Rhodospirillales bacterium]
MTIDKDTVVRIARLSRIAMEDDALEPMAEELNGILAWVEQLGEVDTEGVEPMTGAIAATLPQRDDSAEAGAPTDDLLANAPEAEDGFFVVPRVVE